MARCYARYFVLIALMMIALQVNDARNIGSALVKVGDNNNKSTPYMTYEELLYILKFRHGEENARPKHLTPCARAILGCCNNKTMNEYCSESLKCGSYFFDDNPCEDKFIIEALEAARVFYEQFNSIAA